MRDISDLYYSFDIQYAMAAVIDIQMKVLVKANWKASGDYAGDTAGDYITKRLKMLDSDHYYNTGVCVFNLDVCRNMFKRMVEEVNSVNYWFLEQDIFNIFLGNNTVELDPKWNCMVTADRGGIKRYLGENQYLDYLENIKGAYVIHYAGGVKPWGTMRVPDYMPFIKYSRNTPWYDYIIENLIKNLTINDTKNIKQIENLNHQITSMNQRVQQLELIVNKNKKRTIRLRIRDASLKATHNLMPQKYYDLLWYQYSRLRSSKYRSSRREMIDRVLVFNKAGNIPGTPEKKNKEMIKSYRNKYLGKRCFIIGNGPSLNKDDLDLIKDEITFGMNSLYRIFTETDWRPTFYFNNDIALEYRMKIPVEERYSDYKESLDSNNKSIFFTTSSKFNNDIVNNYPDHIIVFLPVIDYLYQFRQPNIPYWSNDCSKKMYAFGTTSYLIMQMVSYMGFKEVIFLGMDMDYSGKSHFYEDNKDKTLYSGKDSYYLQLGLERGYSAIAHYARKKGIKIYNATRGGKLSMFPRISLEKLEDIK